ncbi:MAG: ATP-binding protein [Thermodesulfobacteriota bacterium]
MISSLLLVDHEAPAPFPLVEELLGKGLSVSFARSAREGIALGSRRSHDAIVVERRVGTVDGFNLLNCLKPVSPGAVTMVIGGDASDGLDKLLRLKHGVFQRLDRPLTAEAVQTGIRLSVSQKKSEAQRVSQRLEEFLHAQVYERLAATGLDFPRNHARPAFRLGAADVISSHTSTGFVRCVANALKTAKTHLSKDPAARNFLVGILDSAVSTEAVNKAVLAQESLPGNRDTVIQPYTELARCLGKHRNLFTVKRISVRISARNKDAHSQMEPFYLGLLLDNLILNAVEAMDYLQEKNLAVDFSINLRSGFLRITITDTGCGMSSETMDRIFTSGFSTSENGAGLGLSAVKKILFQCSGDIHIQSKVGRGTTTTVVLPLARPGAKG